MGAEVFFCTFVAAISSLYMQSAPGVKAGQASEAPQAEH